MCAFEMHQFGVFGDFEVETGILWSILGMWNGVIKGAHGVPLEGQHARLLCVRNRGSGTVNTYKLRCYI